MTHSTRPRMLQAAEAAGACVLLLWRVVAHPPQALFRDWIALLAAYWIFTVFASRSKAWPYVTAGTMVLLAAIYLEGQLPHTLASLGLGL